MEQGKLIKKSSILFFFLLCFLAYFSTYLGRLNYSASLTEMIHAENFSKGQAGLIGSVFFCSYGLGQLVSGFLGDRLNCKWLVFCGLAISGIMNLLMGLAPLPELMTLIWCLNGISQAMIWSPMLHLICELLNGDVRFRFCVYINYSVPLGTVCAYGISALMIGISGWRAAFFFPSIFMLAVALLWLIGIKRLGWTFRKLTKENKVSKKESRTSGSYVSIFLSSGLIFLSIALFVQGALKDGVTTWIPTYLNESYGIDTVGAVLSTLVIPLCNLAGVFLASLAERWIKHNEILSAAVFYMISGIALIILWISGECSIFLSLAMFAVATTSMMSVNSLLISVLPSRFGGIGMASGISGLMNSFVYAGCAASTYGIGILSEVRGWNFTIMIWFLGALTALGICLGIQRKWKLFYKGLLNEESQKDH